VAEREPAADVGLGILPKAADAAEVFLAVAEEVDPEAERRIEEIGIGVADAERLPAAAELGLQVHPDPVAGEVAEVELEIADEFVEARIADAGAGRAGRPLGHANPQVELV